MVWFNVDDGFMTHPKVLSIPRGRRIGAAGVWTLIGTWCARNLTDGFVPRYALEELPGAEKFAADLVAARLWETVDGGWSYRNWSKWNRTKSQILKDRTDTAARQQAFRDRKKVDSNAVSNALRNGDGNALVTAPLPTPHHTTPSPSVVPTELPKRKTSSRSSRGTRLPEDWQPTLDQIGWVRTNCPEVDGRVETMKFRNHFVSKAGPNAVKLDWNGAYQNWMFEAVQRGHSGRPTNAGQAGRSSRGVANAEAAMALAAQFYAAENRLKLGAS